MPKSLSNSILKESTDKGVRMISPIIEYLRDATGIFRLKLSELFTEINEDFQFNQTLADMSLDEDIMMESPGSFMSSPLAVVWNSGSEESDGWGWDLHSELSKDSDWSFSDLCLPVPSFDQGCECQECNYLNTSSNRSIKEEDYDADESELEDN